MGIRVDPRTGMIITGPRRPLRSPPSKKVKQPEPEVPPYLPNVAMLTMDQLKEFAQEIGKAIAAQLNVPAALPILPARKPYVSEDSLGDVFDIDIDESIIDVGIGKQDPLKKGQGSAKIATEATEQDNLSSAKQALRAMKVK